MQYWFKRMLLLISILTILPSNGAGAERISVFVSIVPQKYFVQQIGKELVDVQAMVQPGASPATYEPKPQQMVDLSKCAVYFAVGVPFEHVWLEKIAAANPKMKVVHTDHGIEKRTMVAHHHEDVDESPEGDHQKEDGLDEVSHDESGLDPHTWLSPPLVKIQANAILSALQQIDPVNSNFYQSNFNQFVAQIDQLDDDLKEIFVGKKGFRFMVFHPAWGYFAQAYGLKQVPIEIEGKAPKLSQLKALIQDARDSRIKVIFVQPQFSTKSAAIVAREIGGQVAFADPLAEAWVDNLREIAEKFKVVLK